MRAPTGVLSRTGVAFLLALGSIGGLAACSGDDPKPGHVQSPTSPSTTSSPTPTTPEAQIEAAVRAYYIELTHAAQTNDTSVLKTLTTKGCPCYRPVTVIERGAQRGEVTPDAVWTVDSLRVHDVEAETGLADVRYHVSAYDVVKQSGRVVDSIPAQRSHYDLSMVRASDGRWIIANVFDLEG